jgi:hypothetical protein
MPVEVRREHYYNAALERFAEVKRLRGGGHGDSALAAYLCGVSVECALRSLIPEDAEFYDRHDFLLLARSGALVVADQSGYARLGRLLNQLTPLWKNSLRYYSEQLFETYCHKRARSLGLHVQRGSRAALVVCRRLFEAAENAILECERLWVK